MQELKDNCALLQTFPPLPILADIIKQYQILFDSDGDKTKQIANLRKLLSILIENNRYNHFVNNNTSLADIAYESLIALANLYPINDIDPITQTEIPAENKIAVSTGHHFDIETLIEYHNARGYRGSSLHEQVKEKWLLNCITNQNFNPRDVKRILKSLADKNKNLNSKLAILDLLQVDDLFQKAMNIFAKQQYNDIKIAIRCLELAAFGQHAEAAYILAEIHLFSHNPLYESKVLKKQVLELIPELLERDVNQGYQYLLLSCKNGSQQGRLGYIKNYANQFDLDCKILEQELLEESYFPYLDSKIDLIYMNYIYVKNLLLTKHKQLSTTETINKLIAYSEGGCYAATNFLVNSLNHNERDHPDISESCYPLLFSDYREKIETLVKSQTEHNEKAINCLKKLAESGHSTYSHMLAEMYRGKDHLFDIFSPIEKDIALSIRYYQLSIEQGKFENILELASLLILGEDGFPQDYQKAIALLEEGCQASNVNIECKQKLMILIMKLYLFNTELSEDSARLKKIVHYATLGSEHKNKEAATVLLILSLFGLKELNIKPNFQFAKKLFDEVIHGPNKTFESSQCYLQNNFYIAQTILRISQVLGLGSPAKIINHFLYYFLRGFELHEFELPVVKNQLETIDVAFLFGNWEMLNLYYCNDWMKIIRLIQETDNKDEKLSQLIENLIQLIFKTYQSYHLDSPFDIKIKDDKYFSCTLKPNALYPFDVCDISISNYKNINHNKQADNVTNLNHANETQISREKENEEQAKIQSSKHELKQICEKILKQPLSRLTFFTHSMMHTFGVSAFANSNCLEKLMDFTTSEKKYTSHNEFLATIENVYNTLISDSPLGQLKEEIKIFLETKGFISSRSTISSSINHN